MNTELSDWVSAMTDAAIEFGQQMLDAQDAAAGGALSSMPGSSGAYLALVGDQAAMQLGVVATPTDCATIARALLMMNADEAISQEDIADAINEVINVVAGGVKSRLIDREPGLTLGLPLFVDGQVVATHSVEWAGQTVKLVGAELHLVVIRQPK